MLKKYLSFNYINGNMDLKYLWLYEKYEKSV